jgi:selenocysteine lyase/cysteine desulfurase
MTSGQGVAGYRNRFVRVHNRVSDEYSKHTLQALGETEVLRLSACHYNTPQEIDQFLQVTQELLEGRVNTDEDEAFIPLNRIGE